MEGEYVTQTPKKRKLPSFMITPKIRDIKLNYGIEIETVFELTSEYIAYNEFINNYLKNKKYSFDTIKNFIKCLNICITKEDDIIRDIRSEIEKLQRNEVYINLIRKDPDYDIDNYLTDKLNNLITLEQNTRIKKNEIMTDDINIIMDQWIEFINTGIKIIKYILEKNQSEFECKDAIEILLNIPTEDDIENNIYIAFTNIFDLTSNIKLYNIIDENDISDFYNEKPEEEEIKLCLTYDSSVICNEKKIYKDIKSGKIEKYHYLLNNCEFITQPFKSIDEINIKLSKFFDDPIIKNTLLNCEKTSQHVHISFNNDDIIIKPDIYLILTIVCICLYFQDTIFRLFLNTRSNNKYCKKLNYYNTLSNPNIYIINNTDLISNYQKYIKNIITIFYEKEQLYADYYNNRYYWLNILNLCKFDDKPYTIEFRLKHGSTDIEELCNVCKLYENIIKYAIDLLSDETHNLKGIRNINDFKIKIDEIISRNKSRIFDEKILKDIKDYFTNSDYIRGLTELNRILISDDIELSGGKRHSLRNSLKNSSLKNNIETIIKKYENKPLYKKNSFGDEYIGLGINDDLKEKLREKFKHNITTRNLKNYLKLHNIFLK